jgi:hypothetical protein
MQEEGRDARSFIFERKEQIRNQQIGGSNPSGGSKTKFMPNIWHELIFIS